MNLYKTACLLFLALWLPLAGAADKIAIVSTKFVLERKFQLMEAVARQQGVELAWAQVDRDDGTAARRALAGAKLVIIDAPRTDDQAAVEKAVGKSLRESKPPLLHVNVMSPPTRFRAENLSAEQGERLFNYYINGTAANREHLFGYIKTWLAGGDLSQVPEPVALPNGGIYHPEYPQTVFADLPAYLAWWRQHSGKDWQNQAVIAMEMSSSYISDGQTRMLDETVQAVEKAGGMPLLFYRASRMARAQADMAGARASGRPVPAPAEASAKTVPSAASADAGAGNEFPNPKARRVVEIDEPLITLDGKLLPRVLLVNTFLGMAPDSRKAWHQALGIPAINVLAYRTGNKAEYMKDLAGINSFYLPMTLINAEYIGLIDPVVLTANEGGELVPMPEQMDMLVGKAMKLAKLQTMNNADKKVALLFWNHPPGEKNQGASNLNVPRSLEKLIADLRADGYGFEPAAEQEIIDAVGNMLRPVYRPGTLNELMAGPNWDFLPLERYKAWYAGLPESVRKDVEQAFGKPEDSKWLASKDGVPGFVIPRMQRGNLIVLPQPPRGEIADEREKKLFHDTKMPLNHFYMAAYLWIREVYQADAIVHFGTHGSQEWTPGKERGLWAYDYPNILVGNTPVVYPYIVDNINEAIHVKRRGRGVIVSHQTPAFAPAGLSDDFVKINDLIREYRSVDQGLVKDNSRKLIIEQAVKMNIHKDMKWQVADLEREFDKFLRDIEDYLEDLGSAMQPLGLHTFGKDAENEHLVSNVMQMLGQSLYAKLGVDSKQLFKGDYKALQQTAPYRFVADKVFSEQALDSFADADEKALVEKGRKYRADLKAPHETEALKNALAARWIDPSYGGDPIRNPDSLPTGRNMYGFDPARVPTRAAYEAGKQAIENLIREYQSSHNGEFPKKLTFTMWSSETMRHMGMLEGQVLYAMGAKPKWDDGGRVTGMEVIPQADLGRPRIDTIISLTGLYRDQFPNVMERFNEAIAMIAKLDEKPELNLIRANTLRIKALLTKQGVDAATAEEYALTRIYGNESGDYSTKLTPATLASDQWNEGDGNMESLYLSRMSWAYGPNTAHWSQKLKDKSGKEINAYAEHLKGTSAAVFSRSSNLRGLLDTDHPFEYLGGISMAVRHLDGKSPQLYISNMRDPNRTKLETAEKFLSTELRAVYQHPNWMKEMQKEGYSGTLQMLNTINNFWGWQAMDRNVVRDDQWQEFHETYVKDKYKLGMRDWFEKNNPTALAQISERMLEAIRKDYWQADEQTKRELVQVYQEIAAKHDVYTANETFKAYVAELAQGYGISVQAAPTEAQPAAAPQQTSANQPVQGQQLEKVEQPRPVDEDWLKLLFLLPAVLALLAGMAWQARRQEVLRQQI
ncbi:MAG: cobaltochelatase subunit CobN [Methylococcaceae bacterium]|nr:cobaltochelatase subunit CobN [Methylococcaceae bacterium]